MLLAVCLFASTFPIGQTVAIEPPPTDEKYRVVLFTGSDKDNPFWNLFVAFMSEVGSDLDVKVEVFYAEGSPNQMKRQIRMTCQQLEKPDAIIVQTFKGSNGLFALRKAEEAKIPVFLVNAGLTEYQRKEAIGPRSSKFRFWLGEKMPDDKQASVDLTNALIDEALKDPSRLAPDGKVHIIALNGVITDGASIQRVAGLREAVRRRSDEAVLDQVVSAKWEKEKARFCCFFLHRRYPQASVIWCASDLMAEGAIEASLDRNVTPGTDVIIGGFDAATPAAMDLIKQGHLSATIGGHFMDGGWVTVLLHDYLAGVDLDQIPLTDNSKMTLVTRDNVADYEVALDLASWKRTDFRQLSRLTSSKFKAYQFGWEVLAKNDETKDSSSKSLAPHVSETENSNNE